MLLKKGQYLLHDTQICLLKTLLGINAYHITLGVIFIKYAFNFIPYVFNFIPYMEHNILYL